MQRNRASPAISCEKSTSWVRSNSSRFASGVIDSSSSVTCAGLSARIGSSATISPCRRKSGGWPDVRCRSEQSSLTIFTNSDSIVRAAPLCVAEPAAAPAGADSATLPADASAGAAGAGGVPFPPFGRGVACRRSEAPVRTTLMVNGPQGAA